MDSIVINFVGEPNAGKTTLAAHLFATLKSHGESAEFVSEYIKQLIYLEDYDKINDQEYVSTYQYKLLKGAIKKIRYVVTDAPLVHGIAYNRFHEKNDEKHKELNKKIAEWIKEFNNFFVLVEPNPKIPYRENEGRIHSKKDSEQIGKIIVDILKTQKIPYITVSPDNQLNIKLAEDIYGTIKKK
jgi:nicotinamide riboside kinase